VIINSQDLLPLTFTKDKKNNKSQEDEKYFGNFILRNFHPCFFGNRSKFLGTVPNFLGTVPKNNFGKAILPPLF